MRPTDRRSSFCAMARQACGSCHGTGLRPDHGNSKDAPCPCCCRAVCKAVIAHCRHLVVQQDKPRGKRTVENYLSDVWLSAKRVLNEREFDIFRWHYLQGASFKVVCARLKLARGAFFHHCYRIEERMGLYWLLQLKPYSVFPISAYNYRDPNADIRPMPRPPVPYPNGAPLRPPMGKPAPAAPAFDYDLLSKQVSEMRASGMTLMAIADHLRQVGVPTQRGGDWYASTVSKMLGASVVMPVAPVVPEPCAPVPIPAPAVVPVPLAPVPAVVPAPIDVVIQFMRHGVRHGRSLPQIAKDLNAKAPAPNGIVWCAKDVKRALLDAPRGKQHRRRRQQIELEGAA